MNNFSTEDKIRLLETRISGLMEEKNASLRELKSWKAKAQQAQKKIVELEDTICQMKEGF